jgi:hypothetical protein
LCPQLVVLTAQASANAHAATVAEPRRCLPALRTSTTFGYRGAFAFEPGGASVMTCNVMLSQQRTAFGEEP